jgi:hypothetical protein
MDATMTDDAISYKSKSDVLAYLQQSGWRVAKATLYLHCNQGKLVPDKSDGAYRQSAVDKYAKTFLRRTETGKKVSKEVEALQAKKAALEVAKLEEEVGRIRRKREAEEQQYMSREEVEMHQALRACVLHSGLADMIKLNAARYIAMAEGNGRKSPDLIRAMLDDTEALLMEYLRPITFEAINDFDDEEEHEEQDESSD